MHQVAITYGVRPSTLLELTDTWAAYQFDVAVMSFAQWVESQLEHKRSLRELLMPPGDVRIWANPMALFGPARRMQVPESGIW